MAKFKTSILYGLIVSLAGSVLMISLVGLKLIGPKAIPLDNEMVGGTVLFLFLYLFLLFGIYFAIKKKKQQNGQTISFKEALLQGILVSLSTAVFSVLFTYLFYDVLYPNYVNEILEALKIKMESVNVPKQMVDEKLLEKETYYSTSVQSFYSFIGNLITGVAFALLLSFFLKSNSKR
jgi:ABC-type sulfate transport system permease component